MAKLTSAEEKAIDSLKRLAKRWPKTLMLASMGGSLCVIPADDHEREGGYGIDPDKVLADIDGIPSTGGDW